MALAEKSATARRKDFAAYRSFTPIENPAAGIHLAPHRIISLHAGRLRSKTVVIYLRSGPSRQVAFKLRAVVCHFAPLRSRASSPSKRLRNRLGLDAAANPPFQRASAVLKT